MRWFAAGQYGRCPARLLSMAAVNKPCGPDNQSPCCHCLMPMNRPILPTVQYLSSGRPFCTCPIYRQAELRQAITILQTGQLWSELFTESFPLRPFTFTRQSGGAVITCLLSSIWEHRLPIWENDQQYHRLERLIDHLKEQGEIGRDAVLSWSEVACLEVYLLLGMRMHQLFPENTQWLEDMAALGEQALARAVEDFLTAVNQHYFPVWEEVWDTDPEFLLGRLQTIDLEAQGYSLDEDIMSLDDFCEPVRTLFYIAGATPGGDDGGYGGAESLASLPIIDLAGLSGIVRQMKLPKVVHAGLPVLLDMIMADTGNEWLDWSAAELAQGYVMLPGWSVENALFLKQEWQKAQKLLAKEAALIAWVSADETTRLPAIRSLIYLAYLDKRGIFHEWNRSRPCHSHPLPGSDHPGKSAERWLPRHPSHLSGRPGGAAQPDSTCDRPAAG